MFAVLEDLAWRQGGWFPLTMAIGLFVVLSTWKEGRALLSEKAREDAFNLKSFFHMVFLDPPHRASGTAVFLTAERGVVPNALLHNLKHNKVLHDRVLFVTISNRDVPEVTEAERIQVTELAANIWRVIVAYGFMESPNLPRDLVGLGALGIAFDPMQASYFLSRETIVPAVVPRLPVWRLWLFLLMARNAISTPEFFRIPSDRVVELGVRVAL